MTKKEQDASMLKQWLKARMVAPWITDWFCFFTDNDRRIKAVRDDTEWHPAKCLHRLGGLAGEW